ncbi:MAG: nucleotidyltransferase [Labilithrix sp.]|nr:nucleotidyltransferase [Labilithrix sp.]MCW5813582.1 nucleotidyltransferase [Labilithrix sp.]
MLRDLRSAFESAGVRWYLFGAQAAIAYGVARFKDDIDVMVDPGSLPLSRIRAALEARGFVVMNAAANIFRVKHARRGVLVDVVVSRPSVDEVFYARLVRRKLGGVFVPVAAPEDIIALKLLAARDKDTDDVKVMLQVNRSIRLSRTREVLGLLEESLAISDLSSAFERILKAARR